MARCRSNLFAAFLFCLGSFGIFGPNFSLFSDKRPQSTKVGHGQREIQHFSGRRRPFAASILANLIAISPAFGKSSAPLIIPLEFERGAFLLRFQVQGSTFRGVADTGSPFLLVASCAGARRAAGRCSEYCSRYGCSQKEVGSASGLDDNIVVFTGGYSRAFWRTGAVQLGSGIFRDTIFGVLEQMQDFGGNSGGQNVGLIRAAAEDSEIRPTFLSQTPYKVLSFELRNLSSPVLELASTPGQPRNEIAARLVDLRTFGAGVQYYSVAVQALLVDGVDILESESKPTVAILDTGTTGLVLPKHLFFAFDTVRRARAQEVGIRASGNVKVQLAPLSPGSKGPSLQLRRGRIPELDAALDIVTPLSDDAGSVFLRAEMRDEGRQTKVERPTVIFLGLGFFAGLRMEIDSKGNTATFT